MRKLSTIFVSLIVLTCSPPLFAAVSVADTGIVLTINGTDPTIQPLELESKEQILIGLSGEAELTQNKYLHVTL